MTRESVLFSVLGHLEALSPTFARSGAAQRIREEEIPLDFSVGLRGEMRVSEGDGGAKRIIMGSHQILARCLWQFAHAIGHCIPPPQGLVLPMVRPEDRGERLRTVISRRIRTEKALALSFATQVLWEVSVRHPLFMDRWSDLRPQAIQAYEILSRMGLEGLIEALELTADENQMLRDHPSVLASRYVPPPGDPWKEWTIPLRPPPLSDDLPIAAFDGWMRFLIRCRSFLSPKMAAQLTKKQVKQLQGLSRIRVDGPEAERQLFRFIDAVDPTILREIGLRRHLRSREWDIRYVSSFEIRRNGYEGPVDVRPDLNAIQFREGGRLTVLVEQGRDIGDLAAPIVYQLARFTRWSPSSQLPAGGTIDEQVRALYRSYVRSEYQGLLMVRRLMTRAIYLGIELPLDHDEGLMDSVPLGFSAFLDEWERHVADDPEAEESILGYLREIVSRPASEEDPQ